MERSRPRAAVVLAALLLLASGSARSADPLEDLERAQVALFERVAPSVVFITDGKGFGSGFFVSPDGLILTNRHVVGTAKSVDVVRSDGQRLRGKIVELAKDDLDLALVKVDVRGAPVLPLDGFSQLKVGSWVGAVGHGKGAIWTFNTGMVSNIYPDGAERPVFQTQIPLNPGNSGGPIFDRQGRVAGVVTAGDMQAQSLNFAIRVDQALMRLEGLAGLGAFLTIRVGEVAPIFVNGKMVGSGPHLVIPITPGTHEVFAVVKGTMHRAKVTFPGQREVQLGPPDAEKQDARAEDKP